MVIVGGSRVGSGMVVLVGAVVKVGTNVSVGAVVTVGKIKMVGVGGIGLGKNAVGGGMKVNCAGGKVGTPVGKTIGVTEGRKVVVAVSLQGGDRGCPGAGRGTRDTSRSSEPQADAEAVNGQRTKDD